jgi:hypothetical protein
LKDARLKYLCPVALLLAVVANGHAQIGYNRPITSPTSRPAVSPYLNLTRPGNTALNYFNLVRPEFEFRNAYQGIQRQVNRQGEELQAADAGFLPPTGHSTSFLNLSHYYPGRGGPGVSRGLGASGVRSQFRGGPAAPTQAAPVPRRR